MQLFWLEFYSRFIWSLFLLIYGDDSQADPPNHVGRRGRGPCSPLEPPSNSNWWPWQSEERWAGRKEKTPEKQVGQPRIV